MNIRPVINNAFCGGKLTINVKSKQEVHNDVKRGIDSNRYYNTVTIDVDHISEITDKAIMLNNEAARYYDNRHILFYDSKKGGFDRLINAYGALQAANKDDMEIRLDK